MKTIEETMRECGALLKGHFLLSSGRHANQYLEKAEICADPVITADFCWEIACSVISQFNASDKNRIKIVVGLAPIGVVLANRVAEYLGDIYQENVISIFAEKDDKNQMVFRRGYGGKIYGRKVLIVDDILTTGASIGKIKKEIERLSGEVIGAAVICQRGQVRSEDLMGTQILSLVKLEMKDWSPEECPLCQEHIPLVDPKSR